MPKNRVSSHLMFCIFSFSKCLPHASPSSCLSLAASVTLDVSMLLQPCGRHPSPWGPALPRSRLLHEEPVDSAHRERLIAPLFHTICLAWTHSKHAGFAGRMIFLLQKFCNLLIDRVRKIYIWVTAEKLDVSLMGI